MPSTLDGNIYQVTCLVCAWKIYARVIYCFGVTKDNTALATLRCDRILLGCGERREVCHNRIWLLWKLVGKEVLYADRDAGAIFRRSLFRAATFSSSRKLFFSALFWRCSVICSAFMSWEFSTYKSFSRRSDLAFLVSCKSKEGPRDGVD